MSVDRLKAALWSDDLAEAVSAIEATPLSPNPQLAAIVEARLKKRAVALLVKCALRVLGSVGSQAQEGVLMRYVGNPNVEVRQTAVAALLKVSEGAGLRAVVELSTGDPHPCLRSCCLSFLRGLSAEVLASLLDEMSRSPGSWMFRAAGRCSAALRAGRTDPDEDSRSFDEIWRAQYVPAIGTRTGKPSFYEGEVEIDGLFDDDASSSSDGIRLSEMVVVEGREEPESVSGVGDNPNRSGSGRPQSKR